MAVLALALLAGFSSPSTSEATVIAESVASKPGFWNDSRIQLAESNTLNSFNSQPRREQLFALDTIDPNIYPHSAIGTLYGIYSGNGRTIYYSCSGSVVDSPQGNIVVTAAHCVIEPQSGVETSQLVFIPGYRDGGNSFGRWNVNRFYVHQRWRTSVEADLPDEARDVAFLQVSSAEHGESIQSVVGSLGIGFNRGRQQNYAAYGYPSQEPYDGSKLFSQTAPLLYQDESFFPNTLGIQSDFTPGASGGPWLVGQTVLSVSAYRYYNSNKLTSYIFGPYFDNQIAKVFIAAGGLAELKAEFHLGSRQPMNGGSQIKVGTTHVGALLIHGPLIQRKRVQTGTGARKISVVLKPYIRKNLERPLVIANVHFRYRAYGQKTIHKNIHIRLRLNVKR